MWDGHKGTELNTKNELMQSGIRFVSVHKKNVLMLVNIQVRIDKGRINVHRTQPHIVHIETKAREMKNYFFLLSPHSIPQWMAISIQKEFFFWFASLFTAFLSIE